MRICSQTIVTAAVFAAALGTTTAPSRAQDAGRKPAAAGAAAQHPIYTPDQVKWGPGSPALPAGAEMAVLDGDPAAQGGYVLRVKFPDGYRVPPHWHPADENVTVVSGTLMAGMGDKFDVAAMKTLPAGSFVNMKANMRHYVQAKGATVVQVHGIGPFAVTYVNPADDPRNKK